MLTWSSQSGIADDLTAFCVGRILWNQIAIGSVYVHTAKCSCWARKQSGKTLRTLNTVILPMCVANGCTCMQSAGDLRGERLIFYLKATCVYLCSLSALIFELFPCPADCTICRSVSGRAAPSCGRFLSLSRSAGWLALGKLFPSSLKALNKCKEYRRTSILRLMSIQQ